MAVAEHPPHSKTGEPREPSFAVVDKSISDKNREALQPCLSDLIALGIVIKQLHWNVVGPNFRPIHLHLDEIYEAVEEFTDEVAERISQMGHSPNGRLADVLKEAHVKDAPTGFIRDVEVLAIAADRLKVTASDLRKNCDSLEDVDPSTADLLHAVIHKLEMHHWMIQAQRI